MSCCPSPVCAPIQPCAIENFGLTFPSIVGPMGPPGGPGLYVENYTALRAINASVFEQGYVAWASGYAAIGDGGSGNFYYDAGSVAADNDGTILSPANGIGRWIRIFSGPVHLKWFGPKGDGVTDDTTKIKSAITATHVGGTLIINSCSSSYIVDSADFFSNIFTITSPITIIGEPNSLIKLATLSNLRHLSHGIMILVNSYDVTLDGLQVDGNFTNNPIVLPNVVGPATIVFVNTIANKYVNYVIKNCTVNDSGFESIGIGSILPSSQATIMHGVRVENNKISLGFQDQISVGNARDVVVENNFSYNPGSHAIHIYQYATQVSVVNNTVMHSVGLVAAQQIEGIVVGHNGYPGTVSEVSVIGNHIKYPSDDVDRIGLMAIGTASNVVFSSNTVIGGITGILAGFGSYNCIISDNVFSNQWFDNASLRGLKDSIFANNQLRGANSSATVAVNPSSTALYLDSEVGFPGDSNSILNNTFSVGLGTPKTAMFLDTAAFAPTNNIIAGNNMAGVGTFTQIANLGGTNLANTRNNIGVLTENAGFVSLGAAYPHLIPHGLINTPVSFSVLSAAPGAAVDYVLVDVTNIKVYAANAAADYNWSAQTW